jgi:SAM-dependent methyltransferase
VVRNLRYTDRAKARVTYKPGTMAGRTVWRFPLVPGTTVIAHETAIPEQLWRCPRCKGQLIRGSDRLTCTACSASYGFVGDIPDLRVPGASWIDQAQDRSQAGQLIAETRGLVYRDMIAWIFAKRSDWDKERIDLRTEQIIAAPERLRLELEGWLEPLMKCEGYFLDVGCGNGTLLAAAASLGRQGIGMDVSMVWLQIAARMIKAYGGQPILAAAMAEALPLADDTVSSVVSLDVIEHVADPGRYLAEINRVTKQGGFLALATPNRFSIAAEPHVLLWGVGFLPRAWQKPYVRWRGANYECTRLLSPSEVARLMRRITQFRTTIMVSPISELEIALFSNRRRLLARLYNRLLALGLRWLLLPICPFFRVVGIRSANEGPSGQTCT